MDQVRIQASAWYNALTLTERLALLRGVQGSPPRVGISAELGKRRLLQWRSQPPFENNSYFDQRLAVDGLSEDDFVYLLGERNEAVRNRAPCAPAWLAQLAQMFSRAATPWQTSTREPKPGLEIGGFLNATGPLITWGRERVREATQILMRMYPHLPFDPKNIEDILAASLPWQLIQMLGRTLVLELNVARLEGLLEGDTPEERFQHFISRLQQPATALAILREYPVLARQLTLCVDHWAAFSREFLRHLCADWKAIRSVFTSEDDAGVLVEVRGNAGDNHRGGRNVQIARFSSGFQLVYKPRQLALDRHFQELLAWINNRSGQLQFRTLEVLDRDTYGWVEFVDEQACTSSEQIPRFYERQGGYLALLYALEATDFHYENLIAAAEHPILIDLEALFHPRVGGGDVRPVDQLVSNTLNYSVLGVGLLPQRIWSNAEFDGIDLSGLGMKAGQLTPYRVPRWAGEGTDEMRFIRERVVMPNSKNQPMLNESRINVLDYADAIVTGFTTIYQLLLRYRTELLSNDGPLRQFAEDEVRVIARATSTYGTLLQESFHPDVLRDALDRDRLFDRLWVAVERFPYLAKLIPAERDDLLKGDIPIFTTRPSSRDLWTSSTELISDFFDESSMTLVRRRLQQLSDRDLGQQLWFIRASLTSLSLSADQKPRAAYPPVEPQITANREAFLEAARAVGDRLETLALRDKHDVSWIGLALVDGRHWSIVPMGWNLYDGLPGVAIFLAYLGAATGEECYVELAQSALTSIRYQVEQGKTLVPTIGAFDGWGGIIYTLTHLGTLWKKPALLSEAEGLIEHLSLLIERDDFFDIISGAAGCIGSLISLYKCAPSDLTLAVAIECGDHLIARAQPMARGVGWLSRLAKTNPLTGFSHGAAGIAWALLELSALSGEERFRSTALAAIDYERSVFSLEAGNWPDFRNFETSGQRRDDSPDKFMTAWCHGAPGIGLARLRSLHCLDDEDIRLEIITALKTTLFKGFGINHSLCHGDLGNLELLLQASQELDDPLWETELNRIAAIVLESISRNGWLCANPLGVESPELMTGLSGIGYGLLRLADPGRVPSLVVLEPPRYRWDYN